MIINDLVKQLADSDVGKIEEAIIIHTALIAVHSKVLAAHCECLGMNAENMCAAITNTKPVYRSKDYKKMMQKWELIDEEGNPII